MAINKRFRNFLTNDRNGIIHSRTCGEGNHLNNNKSSPNRQISFDYGWFCESHEYDYGIIIEYYSELCRLNTPEYMRPDIMIIIEYFFENINIYNSIDIFKCANQLIMSPKNISNELLTRLSGYIDVSIVYELGINSDSIFPNTNTGESIMICGFRGDLNGRRISSDGYFIRNER